jgi:hypothetical protein
MLAALHMLLEVERLFGTPAHRLPTLLRDSRKHQADVSAKLSGQVLGALHALLRGLHAADLRMGTHRVAWLAHARQNELYGGLLTALMRLVFVLYAEDRGLFPDSEIWTDNYALSKLFDRLRTDAALNPDTMEDRFGAWAQVCARCAASCTPARATAAWSCRPGAARCSTRTAIPFSKAVTRRPTRRTSRACRTRPCSPCWKAC